VRDLNYELKQLRHRNRDSSFATQRDRERVLDQIANQHSSRREVAAD
jgi:hypothetical protein